MDPSPAQAPKATSNCDLARIRRAISRFSAVRMAPLKNVMASAPSGSASTSSFLVSSRQGQKKKSKCRSTSRIFSCRFTRAISQPPQEEAQYMLSFGLSMAI